MTRQKIAWQVALTRDSGGRMSQPNLLWDALESLGTSICEPEYAFQLRFVEPAGEHDAFPYSPDVPVLLEDLRQAENEDVAVYMIAPAIDPGVFEARTAAKSASVLGSLGSALSMSAAYGNRVGIVAVHPSHVAMIQQAVDSYGFAGRLLPHRPIRSMPTLSYLSVESALRGDPSDLIGEIESEAQVLVDEGADVIIGACQFFGACLYPSGYTSVGTTGVPFLDPGSAGLLTARLLLRARALVAELSSTAS